MEKDSSTERAQENPSIIRCAISKVQFPEICPVCLAVAEDLVAVTVVERGPSIADRDIHSSWTSGQDKVGVGLEAARGATALWIPACMRHGSTSVRTGRKRFLAWLAYFIVFYPILFFLLSLRNNMVQGRPIEMSLIGLIVSVAIFLILAFYGYFPRALERAIRIIHTDRSRDRLYLHIENEEYQSLFLEMNEMHSDLLDSVDNDSQIH
jgi:hypothetical protein